MKTPKLCVNCKHAFVERGELLKCKQPQVIEREIIFGEPVLASIARFTAMYGCGLKGKLWEKRDG
jgi:hypothetical protein